MGAKLLLVYVIIQIIITELNGITLPFADTIGIVTPVPPKPLSSISQASPITKSPLIWDGEDIMSKLFSPAAPGLVFREFSSPITLTSSSRALPVPKIDQSSMKDVKIPERLGKKLLPSNDYSKNITPSSIPPKESLANKTPLLSPPTKLSNALPYPSSDIYSAAPSKLSSVPSVQSLPPVPLGPFKRSCNDINSASKTNSVPKPPILRSKAPELLTANSLPLNSANTLPYPLYYRSMNLPGVRTPESLVNTNRQITTTVFANFNFKSPLNTFNLLNSPSEINKPCPPSYLNPARIPNIPNPNNMVQIPKQLTTVASQSLTTFPQNSPLNIQLPRIESSTPPVSFKPSLPLTKSSNQIVSSSMADKISDSRLSSFNAPKINPTIKASTPFASPKIPSSPSKFNVLRNCTTTIDNSKHSAINTSNIYPITDNLFKTGETLTPNHHFKIYDHNIRNPYVLIPEMTPYPSALFTKDYVSNPFSFSPPTIPLDPIAPYYSPVPCYSPIFDTPSVTTLSIAQSLKNIAPTFNDIISNLAEKLLLSYKSYLNSITQNVKAANYPAVSPCVYSGLQPQHLPVTSLPRGNSLQTNSILTNLYSPTDYTNIPGIDFSTFTSYDCPYSSPILEMSSSQLSPVTSSQTSTVTTLSPLKYIPSPSLNPSFLPSPAIPPKASSFYTETPAFKIESSKKDSETERLLETMLIAEILNEDESFDWDDLDTFLTLLSLS